MNNFDAAIWTFDFTMLVCFFTTMKLHMELKREIGS